MMSYKLYLNKMNTCGLEWKSKDTSHSLVVFNKVYAKLPTLFWSTASYFGCGVLLNKQKGDSAVGVPCVAVNQHHQSDVMQDSGQSWS